MRLSTVTDEVLTDRSPGAFPRIFETAVREGVTNFEIRMVEAKRFPICESQAWDRMKQYGKEYGITFSAVSPGLFKCGVCHDLMPLYQKYLLPMGMDLAETIGVKTLIVFGIVREQEETADEFKRVVEILRGAVETHSHIEIFIPFEQALFLARLVGQKADKRETFRRHCRKHHARQDNCLSHALIHPFLPLLQAPARSSVPVPGTLSNH